MKTFATALSTIAVALALATGVNASNPKPFTVPEVMEWHGANGTLTLPADFSIAVQSADLTDVARNFAADYAAMFGNTPQINQSRGAKGEIVIRQIADPKLGDEGYSLKIGKNVEITAATPAGAIWATRTLLQMCEVDRSLPKGTITDVPEFGFRGLVIDCGRKFIPLDYLYKLVDVLAYHKMNKLHIHLNDNAFKSFFDNDWDKTYAAFRLESDYFPGLTARDGYYSKDEFRQFQKYAMSKGVEIIPEIDFPAHSLAFTRFRPEIGSTDDKYGCDHLDLMNEHTYNFLDSLITEYIGGDDPVFIGPRFHIGTDEYSNRDSAVVEKFRYLTDRYIRLAEQHGKKPVVWGALTHAKGKQPVKSDGVEMYLWYNGYADPEAMLAEGYDVVSIPDGWVYIVPEAGYYYDYLNSRKIYDEWNPSVIGKVKIDPENPQLKGGMFAVWNDHTGNGVTVKDIHHRIMAALPAMATKTWQSGKNLTRTYDEMAALAPMLSEAPGVNYLGRHPKGTILSADNLQPDTETGIEDIGYDYAIEFTVEGADEPKGTILFESPEATVWLSDPITGFMGFSREDKLYQFRHNIRKGETSRIRIEGDNKATRLFVNGKLVDDLKVRRVSYNEGKNNMAQSHTLVFPLQRTGKFNSRVTDFRAVKY